MKNSLIILLFIGCALCQSESEAKEKKSKVVEAPKIEEVDALRIELLEAKLETFKQQVQGALNVYQNKVNEIEGLKKEALKKAGLDGEEYNVNVSTRSFVKKPVTPKPEAKK